AVSLEPDAGGSAPSRGQGHFVERRHISALGRCETVRPANRVSAILSPRGCHDNEVMTMDETFDGRAWSLLSNHGHALICIAQQPDIRLWELAQTIGVRERSAQRIVNQLVEAGYLTRHQHDGHGARLSYAVNRDHHLRRPHLRPYTVGDLLDTFSRPPTVGEADGAASREEPSGTGAPVPGDRTAAQ